MLNKIPVTICLGVCSYTAKSVCICVCEFDSFATGCRCAVDSFISAGSVQLRGEERKAGRRGRLEETGWLCNDPGVYMGCSIQIPYTTQPSQHAECIRVSLQYFYLSDMLRFLCGVGANLGKTLCFKNSSDRGSGLRSTDCQASRLPSSLRPWGLIQIRGFVKISVGLIE